MPVFTNRCAKAQDHTEYPVGFRWKFQFDGIGKIFSALKAFYMRFELKWTSEVEKPKIIPMKEVWMLFYVGSWSVNIEFGLKRFFIQTIWETINIRSRPYSLNNPNWSNLSPPVLCKKFKWSTGYSEGGILPSNKILPRVISIVQIQIFETYEFHKDSYASYARIQHNIIMFH